MARNRMIKPEFWEDDRIGSLPFETRLFYIALWNFADDEGYLEYREQWLHAKCFPYDKVDIRRMIDELSSSNRVEIRQEDTGEYIIYVVNFLKHQRIDRPRPSDLSKRFNLSHKDDLSTSPRRPFDESSLPKNKLKQVKIKES